MFKDVPYDQYLYEVNKCLSSNGVFLNTAGDRPNTMTIGWGGITFFWGKPTFIVPVRKSRYTHGLLESSGEFTVSIPIDTDLKKALAYCGTKSGRDMDKFAQCGLSAIPARIVDVSIIGECKLHYECKVVYKQDIIPENLNKGIDEKYYPDYHTLYFGEILSCYVSE